MDNSPNRKKGLFKKVISKFKRDKKKYIDNSLSPCKSLSTGQLSLESHELNLSQYNDRSENRQKEENITNVHYHVNLKNCDSIEIKVGSNSHLKPFKLLSADRQVERISWSEESSSLSQGTPKITYSPRKSIRRQTGSDSNNNRNFEIKEFNHSETGPFTPVRNLNEPKPVGLVKPIVRPPERNRSPSSPSSEISAGSSADTATIHALATEILSELEITQEQLNEEYHRPSRSRSMPRRRSVDRNSENRRMRSVDQRQARRSRRETFDNGNQTRRILAQLIRMPGVLLLTTEEEKINITVSPVRQTLTSLVNFLQEQGLSVNDYNLRLAPPIRSSSRQFFV
ncbi:DgyrCDS1141 [Dimorphilus gyrociliatus]|uniref:DgyrCDS1141 n=1 Tax=Dimorphilus gyrociliatus TaxID=2664684 RepID=A0A7I8VBH2_9ANNE|nr:DgyrCDS1141 [Dimorphilus gyrociliatus]